MNLFKKNKDELFNQQFHITTLEIIKTLLKAYGFSKNKEFIKGAKWFAQREKHRYKKIN